jgi:hypothetical protein
MFQMSEIHSLDKRNSAREDEIDFGEGMWGIEAKNGRETDEQLCSTCGHRFVAIGACSIMESIGGKSRMRG